MLIVIDPIARQIDGESVRIARDVLRAGTRGARVCLLERPQEMSRAMAGLSSGRVVVVGDDRALLRAVRALHHRGDLAEHPLGVVPVGPPHALRVSRRLGLPADAVRASRAVLGGTCQELDLLVDDAGGVVLGALDIPAPQRPAAPRRPRRPWWRGLTARRGDGPGGRDGADGPGDADGPGGAARSGGRDGDGGAVRGPEAPDGPDGPDAGDRRYAPDRRPAGDRPGRGGGTGRGHRLRVEADGRVLADLDRPVRSVSVSASDGMAAVVVHHGGPEAAVTARAAAVTISGRGFRYRADAELCGPANRRTWRVRPAALRLSLPGG